MASSLPARGAWIEINLNETEMENVRRSPHGERGLKYRTYALKNIHPLSLPARGAWIEITNPPDGINLSIVAPRTGSVD